MWPPLVSSWAGRGVGTSRVPSGQQLGGFQSTREVHLDFLPADRKIKVVADGLPVGAALQRARRQKENTYLVLGRPRGGSAFGGVGLKRREIR